MSAERPASMDEENGSLRHKLQEAGTLSALAHLVGRTRALLLELEASERELRRLADPRTERVVAAVAAVRDAARQGSLAQVAQEGSEVLRLFHPTQTWLASAVVVYEWAGIDPASETTMAIESSFGNLTNRRNDDDGQPQYGPGLPGAS